MHSEYSHPKNDDSEKVVAGDSTNNVVNSGEEVSEDATVDNSDADKSLTDNDAKKPLLDNDGEEFDKGEKFNKGEESEGDKRSKSSSRKNSESNKEKESEDNKLSEADKITEDLVGASLSGDIQVTPTTTPAVTK